jgi:hypothetical protein
VKVKPYAGTDRAIDLLVEILKGGKSTLRFFGVQVVGRLDLPNDQGADERILSHLERDSLETELPIGVFVIGVRELEGIYRWVVEPVVEDGQAVLRPGAKSKRDAGAGWQTLDEAGVARLIGQVNAWYDARNGGSAPRPRARRSRAE